MIYTVLINSNSRQSGSVSNGTYLYDFSNFQNGSYKLTWGFCSGSLTLTVPKVLLLSVDLGQSTVFLASSNATRAINTNIIGTCIPNETGVTFMYGDKNSNSSIILSGKPPNNQFNIRLLSTDAIPVDFTDSANLPLTEFILSLSFEKI